MKKRYLLAVIAILTVLTTIFSFSFKIVSVNALIGTGKSVYTNLDGTVLSITTKPDKFDFEFNVLEEDDNGGKLELIHVSESLTDIIMFDEVKYDDKTYIVTEIRSNASYYEFYSFRDHTNLTSITLPTTLKKIGISSFNGCTSLQSVVIRGEVETIDGGAFYGCTNLSSVTVESTLPPELGASAFTNCPDSLKIYVPSSSIEAYKTAWSDQKDMFESFTSIADVLPQDFPTCVDVLPDDTWVNDNEINMMLIQNSLVLSTNSKDMEQVLSLDTRTNVLSKDENNYVYSNGSITLTFVCLENVATEIIVSGFLNDYSFFNGTYEPKHIHSIKETYDKVDATCTTSGQEAYYECECGKYFSDSELTNEIEDLQTWLDEDGYIDPLTHDITKIDGTTPTETKDGFMDSYKCNRCSKYFEDEKCTKLIGDEASYNEWKLNSGKVPSLNKEEPNPEENKKDGLGGLATTFIIIGAIILICLVSYIVMFFIWKKNEKALKFLISSFDWINKKIFKN